MNVSRAAVLWPRQSSRRVKSSKCEPKTDWGWNAPVYLDLSLPNLVTWQRMEHFLNLMDLIIYPSGKEATESICEAEACQVKMPSGSDKTWRYISIHAHLFSSGFSFVFFWCFIGSSKQSPSGLVYSQLKGSKLKPTEKMFYLCFARWTSEIWELESWRSGCHAFISPVSSRWTAD